MTRHPETDALPPHMRVKRTRSAPSALREPPTRRPLGGTHKDDRNFRSAFEACTSTPSQFDHQAHVRLAYVYLVECDVEAAVQRMRAALLTFLERNDIPRSKFHETITRAWVLAVRHFMNRSTSTSALTSSQRTRSCSTAR